MRKFKLAAGKPGACIAAWVVIHVWSGCANIKDDTRRTKAEGTAVGVAGGALVGGLLGAVMGMGSPVSIVEGALSWGASGGYQGHAYGSRVADKKKQYASEEAYLEACIGEVDDEMRQCREYNVRAKRVIDQEERQLATLLASGGNRKKDEPGTVTLRQQVENNVKSVGISLEHWDKVIEAHKRVVEKNRDAEQKAKLSAGLKTLEAQNAELHENEQRLVAIRERLPK